MKLFKKALAATAAALIATTNICSMNTQPLIGNIDTVSAQESTSISSQAESAGIEIGNVTCHAGETVYVPLTLFGTSSYGATIYVSVDDPLSISDISGALVYDKAEDGAIFAQNECYSDGDTLGEIIIYVPDSVEPGSFPVNISIETLGDQNGELVENPIGIGGSITIEKAEPTEPTDPIEPIYYEKVDEDEDGTYDYIEISDCDESVETIEIPSEIDDLPVTSIGDNAFEYCSSLTSIMIPDSVTSIGNGAFYGCLGLTSIEIPSSVTSIGEYAFWDCSNLTSIEIPDSVTSIGDCAFRSCSILTSIEIPNSVTSIGSDAFSDCENLTSINVSENNSNYSSIDGVLFNKDKTELICFPQGSEITEYIIPDSVTSIGDSAFFDCSGLTSITIPNSVTSIGDSAFFDCSGLTSITIPSSVTSIGEYTFFACSNLTSIDVLENNSNYSSIDGVLFNKDKTELICFPEESKIIEYIIPESVTSIKGDAFYNCRDLTIIEIPDSVTSIGDSAFAFCSGLTSIEIPDSVTSIGTSAFYGCSGLTSITIENPECEIADIESTISNGYDNGDYYYNGVIRGYENSTAQAYAEKYNRKFESLGEKPINVADMVKLQKYIIKSETAVSKSLDFNSDGIINVIDAVLLRRKLVNG